MRGRHRSRRRRIAQGRLLMLVMFGLLTGCALAGTSATEATICRELRRDLPSYSTRDTPETLDAGARFVAVFEAVCPL